MRLVEFRVQMYRCIIDSSWVKVDPLTVVVGKNESGKTTLLKALHKLKPFNPEPYSMESEWPRGRRQDRDPKQVACTGHFRFAPKELDELENLIGQRPSDETIVEVGRTYDGTIDVAFPIAFFPGRLAKAEIDKHRGAQLAGRGVKDARVLGMEDIRQLPRQRFDTVVMFGNNSGWSGVIGRRKDY